MTNYSTLDASSVRRLMSNVPIWHSNWRVDLALGDAVWAGVSDQTITPIPPSPAFSMPLVPIAPWISGVDNNPLFKCEHCKESFDTAGCLLYHCRLEHGESLDGPANENQDPDAATAYWATKCEDCGKDFASTRQLRQHIKSGIHTDSPRYVCSECDKRFATLGDLHVHEMVHSEDRPYKCDDCDAAFKTSSNLQQHQKLVHSEDKAYKCDDCDAVFKTPSRLKEHQMVHSDEKPFKCNNCDAAFKTSSNLKRHEVVHSNDRPFKCDKCGKAFKTQGDCAMHEKTHSDDKPHKCNKCNAAFHRLSNLRRHEATH
ncbi:hypothetical protein J3E68DRAFT_437429 [Trichoderma sp. SZMC 28012]